MFEDDIERDLRRLEEFVFGDADPAEVGDNLLAEVLGKAAPYTQFTPVNPELPESVAHEKTRMMPRVPPPESRLPEGVDLHGMKTQILDQEERVSRKLKRKHRPRPGANYVRESGRYTEQHTVQVDVEPDPEQPRPDEPLDLAFHNRETQIFDRPEGMETPEHDDENTDQVDLSDLGIDNEDDGTTSER
jgi:hypothetical protein